MTRHVTKIDSTALWEPVRIEPVPLLATLRDLVLEQNSERCPKWAFRVDRDLVFQMQPKPVALLSQSLLDRGFEQVLLRFELEVLLQPGGAPANVFRISRKEIPPPWLQLKAAITATTPDTWILKVSRSNWLLWPSPDSVSDRLAVRSRLVDALHPIRWQSLAANAFLSPRCVFCGKLLTDLASMARMIGPECGGTSSLNSAMYRLSEPVSHLQEDGASR